MNARATLRILHLGAGIIAFSLVFLFLSATLVTELSGEPSAVAGVKKLIVSGLFVLVPALAMTGATGFALGRRNPKGIAATKLMRMKIVAANGLLILVPAAIFLHWKAAAGAFDGAFIAVQAAELVAGTANLILLGMNMRDGLRLTGRVGRPKPAG